MFFNLIHLPAGRPTEGRPFVRPRPGRRPVHGVGQEQHGPGRPWEGRLVQGGGAIELWIDFWTPFWRGLGGVWARVGSENGEKRKEKRREREEKRKSENVNLDS